VAKRKKKRRHEKSDETAYTCPSCGEQIIIPIDVSAGKEQSYGEDCPVCCNPNVIHVEIDEDWDQPRVWAEAE
jgi:transcription elongation factor Elf1